MEKYTYLKHQFFSFLYYIFRYFLRKITVTYILKITSFSKSICRFLSHTRPLRLLLLLFFHSSHLSFCFSHFRCIYCCCFSHFRSISLFLFFTTYLVSDYLSIYIVSACNAPNLVQCMTDLTPANAKVAQSVTWYQLIIAVVQLFFKLD